MSLPFIPVVLSGGTGSRLWPLSRRLHPKQLQPLLGGQAMLQETLSRLPEARSPIVVCNEAHRFLVARQLTELGMLSPAILLEPVGRNTAPAVAMAALHALQSDPDALLLVLPADHAIQDLGAFHAGITTALALAQDGLLVTFGIVPEHPETGYGYIERGAPLEGRPDCYAMARFVEKPDAATAQGYLDAGSFYWNSGMFAFRAATYIEELSAHRPDIHQACQAAWAGSSSDSEFGFVRLPQEAFAACPSDSIDYAVMEKTSKAAVVPLDAGWNDVGSFRSLHGIGDADPSGNVTVGDTLLVQSEGCYVHASSRLVATAGLKDHVIVETPDAVLVAPLERAQEVKAVFQALAQRPEANLHTKVLRPWGSYQSLHTLPGCQVKHIVVDPGASLSLQLHHHRSEHWVILQGDATVTIGEAILTPAPNESVFIPVETQHRLQNFGTEPVELIEVQTGSYLGEDDIERFEDIYGRENS